ncbi:META domain-containing protein [Streptomyces sp. NPDC050636]|uniref:META domain-containing protein n=1 Tax=Streptomyces sp. NPDC050636 TaxID=3154510 RepID=UPI00343A74A1
MPDAAKQYFIDSPWVEFHDDGTASGAYGCTAFRVKAEVRAAKLVVGEDLGKPPNPSATPAPSDSGDKCVPYGADQKKDLADYEGKLKRFFHGPLTITEKPPEKPSERPEKSGNTRLELKNEHGEAVSVMRNTPEGFFDTRWRLEALRPEDTLIGFKSGDDLYFDFHPDGTVTGKLGCNDFTAKAFLSGVHVYFRDPVLTTHRTCPAPNMEDEWAVFGMLSKSRNYAYGASSEALGLYAGVYPFNTGLEFKAMPYR